MTTLFAWKCGSYLYRPQKHEVYLYPTRFEHEAVKVARIDQGIRAGSSLSPGEGKRRCRRVEWQGSLQLPAGCTFHWEESSTRVLPNLSLFNIILAPTLMDEMIAAQKNDESMCHIKRRM
jgi:hypothetical protein